MKKRGLFLIVIFILLILNFISFFSFFSYSAQEPFITHKSRPKISLEFGEPVNILSLSMINTDVVDTEYDLNDFDVTYSVDRTNVTFVSKLPLDNGLYDFIVLVEDLVHNRITYQKKIVVDVPITTIEMYQPRLQRMNKTVGDIVIFTKEPETGYQKNAHCKYVHLLGYSLPKKFETGNTFDITNSSQHVLYDYDFSVPYNKNFYVICVDEDERINYRFFKLDFDLDEPVITDVKFDPPKMITLENNFTLNVTTNEDTFCFFDLLGKKYYFNNLTKDSEFEVGSYTKEHSVILDDVLPEENGIYGFNIVCQDRAFWKVNEVYDYEVDLSAALSIFVETPTEYTSKSSFTLDFFTNKPSYCQYDFDSFGLSQTTSTTDNPLTKHESLIELYAQPGPHNIDIHCVSESAQIGQQRTLEYSFVVDNTPPDKPILTGSNYSCTPNRLELEASSFDNESGIDYYMYMVEESASKTLVNWTKSENSNIVIENSKLNLTHNKAYYVTVEAYNRAGLKSITSTKAITFDETGNSCDIVPPTILVNTSFTFGSTYVSLNCTDNAGQCIDLQYGLVEYGKCVPDMFYFNKFVIAQDYILCYSAMDRAGNIANGTTNVSVFSNPDNSKHCYNSIFEPDLNETDTDCGGECFGCSLGSNCNVNSDCSSKFCKEGICTAPSCNDTFKNGQETDIDCGGSCVTDGFLCSIGQGCLSHKDCTSGFCSENYTCSGSGCSDNIRNGNETDVDCGGSICDGCDVGSSCREDIDCESNYCLNGKCEDYKKKDCDNDGMPDYWEKKYFNCELDLIGCYSCGNPNEDPDDDELINLEEFKKGTNPLKKDTDGDSYSDSVEIRTGYDPLNPDNHPINWLLLIFLFIFFLILAYLSSSYTFDYFKPIRDGKLKLYLQKKEQEELKKKKEQEEQNKKHQPVNKPQVPESSKNIVKKKKVKKSTKKKLSVNLDREKERGRIFDAFEGKKNDSDTLKFKRELAKKLKLKKSKKKKSKKNVNFDSISKTQKLDELEKFENNNNNNSDTNLNSSEESTSELMRKVLNKENDSFENLLNIGKKTDDSFDKLLNRKANNKNTDSMDKLNELLAKRKQNVSKKSDSFDKLSSIGKKEDKNDDLMQKFAQTLQSGQGSELFELLVKKLIDEGKLNKDDVRHLLMEIYLSGKISNDYYNKLKQNLSL